MEEKDLDSMIQDTLYHKTRNINARGSLHNKIINEIYEKSEEVSFMKKIGWKKSIVVAAALCMLGSIVAVGAGKITSLVSSANSNDNQFPTYEAAKKAGTELGYPIQFVEKFSSGYQYAKGNIATVEGLDDADNKVSSFDQLWLEYKGQDGTALNLTVSKPMAGGGEASIPAKAEQEINQIPVSYYCDRYKMFPPDVEIPQEDRDAQERGELYISVGSSKVEEMYSCHVDWMAGGVRYSLMTLDKQMSADEMFKMAREVIVSNAY